MRYREKSSRADSVLFNSFKTDDAIFSNCFSEVPNWLSEAFLLKKVELGSADEEGLMTLVVHGKEKDYILKRNERLVYTDEGDYIVMSAHEFFTKYEKVWTQNEFKDLESVHNKRKNYY